MQPKTIVAIVAGETDVERVLACAEPLAERFGAHLVALHGDVLPMPAASPMGFPDTGLLDAAMEAARDRTERLRVAIAGRSSPAKAEWRSFLGFGGEVGRQIADAARASDLIIVQQADPAADSAVAADSLLFETGRPVLFVPYAGKVDPRFRKAVVAWNGSAEAARAAFDALPFLVEAETVSILCVDPRADEGEAAEFAGAEIAEALSRHGIKVTVINEPSAGLSPGAVIENHLADTSADLLVMGAYSQPWLKQFFFGGATKSLLGSMPVATLMSR